MNGFKSIILFIFLLLFSSLSFATVTITGANGYSVLDNTTTTAPYIFGGHAGTCAEGDSTTTCDSCANSNESPCNQLRVSSSTLLSITYTSDSSTAGTAIVWNDSSSGVIKLDTSSETTYSGAGDSVTVVIPWSTICTVLGGDSDCSNDIITNTPTDTARAGKNNYFYIAIDATGDGLDASDEQLKVQIRTKSHAVVATDYDCITGDTTGICDIIVYPGDEKVFIKNAYKEDDSTLLLEGDFDVKSAMIWYSEGNFSDMTLANAVSEGTLTELPLIVENSELFLSTDRITDLTNGVGYNFRFATKDEAGNIFDIAPSTFYTSTPRSCVGAGTDGTSCNYDAMPDEVFGLLVDDLNCFIATASYGSTLHSNLDILRNFRSKVLSKSQFGKWFIKSYYKWGPKAAQWIYDNPQYKPVIQALLWPMLAFSYLSLKLGFLNLMFLMFTFLGVGTFFVFKWRTAR